VAPARCSSTSRRSGKTCRRWARPGAAVCTLHGAGSPQVSAKADVRLALSELIADGRDPREALLDACCTSDALFREGKQRLLAGEQLSADDLDRFLQHLTRTAALAKVAIDIDHHR